MLSERYKFSDGREFFVGEYTLCGLIAERAYPQKNTRLFFSEIWLQAQHDYNNPKGLLRERLTRKSRFITQRGNP